MKSRFLACAGALALFHVVAAGQAPQGEKSGPPWAAPASVGVWKSVTTGKEYRVRLERDLLHAEWINISPALAKGGAYIRSELRRAGTKWAGTSRLHLPCESVEDNKPVRNWCLLETRIEIDAITSDRITGRGESLRRFDCRVCKILETRWAKFEWVPEGQKAGGGTR